MARARYGFALSRYGWQSAKADLMNCQSISGHMMVPQVFEALDNDVSRPEEKSDIKVSTVRNSRRGKRNMHKGENLDRIVSDSNSQGKYENVKAALLSYKVIYGNMFVPFNFEVPGQSLVCNNDIRWPEETWNMKLGSIVSDIRRCKRYSSYRVDLARMGFDFNPQNRYEYESIKAALLKYQDMYGDMLVPQRFMVPVNDINWPEDTLGINLGAAVSFIRRGQSYPERKEDLEMIGFDFNPQTSGYLYKSVKAALLSYQELNGHMLVPREFTVPANDIRWLKETRGMKLGLIVSNLRSQNSYADHREDLESIGFDYNPQENGYGYESISRALQNYQDIYGNLLVPHRYIVIAGDVEWPKETWGMTLGVVVTSIRSGHSYLDKREELESIGFDYSLQENEFPSERECRKIFLDLFFPSAFNRNRPEWLISPMTSMILELDGYNKKLRIAFEYQGEHHENLHYFNQYDEQLLLEQQERDRFKATRCEERGITLIVIPSKYTFKDPSTMRSFIISELDKFGKYPPSLS
jgi:hypothetical protein